ncbi:MAG: type II toxin-antitoxin system death-on-curing family toxin [Actinomycetota bacterium]|nr:type II toxin-antitoxin system death-on-curing family toxin [Actinomycetota bacterium]
MSGTEDRDEAIYLAIEDILSLYAEIFGCTGRQAADQLRTRDGLESALARPSAYAHYQGADLALQAAVLAHGIAEGQPFVEGNKRTALAACLTFLAINGHRVSASQQERASWILGLSEGDTPERLAERIRASLVPIDGHDSQ